MRVLRQVQFIAQRGLASNTNKTGLIPSAAKYRKIQELQTLFTRDDGLLVWQKRGMRDSVMYQLTMAVMLLGLIPLGSSLWKMYFPRKIE